jgi:hypothetical protein
LVEDCDAADCITDSNAIAMVEDCDGEGAGILGIHECSATAVAEAELIGCAIDICEVSANAISIAENGASTSAVGRASAINDSNASTNNIAEADGNRRCELVEEEKVCSPFAKAVANGDAYAENDSDASSESIAKANGDGASATAGRSCVLDEDGKPLCYGGALATDDSDARAINKATAEGDLSTASATGNATATNGSKAQEYGSAEATDGALSVTSSSALGLDGGSARSYAAGSAEGGRDLNNDGDTYDCEKAEVLPNGQPGGRCLVSETSSAAVSALTVARGSNNSATGVSIGDATNGGQVVSSSNVVSNVDAGVFGIGVGKAITCTPGQVSCGTAYGAALGSGSEGVAVGLTEGQATNGESVNVNVGAGAGAGCSFAGSSASLIRNADGSWSYDSHFNTGLSCVDANASATPAATP